MRCFILFKYRKQKIYYQQTNIFGPLIKGDQKENFRKGLIAKIWRFFKREYFFGTPGKFLGGLAFILSLHGELALLGGLDLFPPTMLIPSS